MLLSALSVLVVAQSSSEILEGLMNNPLCFTVLNSQSSNISEMFVIGSVVGSVI